LIEGWNCKEKSIQQKAKKVIKRIRIKLKKNGNWDWMMKLKTNKTSIKWQKKIEIKWIRTGVEIITKKMVKL